MTAREKSRIYRQALFAVNEYRVARGLRRIQRIPKGRRSHAYKCPLKYALGVYSVWAWRYYLSDQDDIGYYLPTPLFNFREAFDKGEFHELEE